MNETLMQISKLDFCIQEVTLFLDTHPDDQEAMKYYNEGMKRLLKMKETYLKNGGALTNRDGKNLKNYINEPFPWMKGESTCHIPVNDIFIGSKNIRKKKFVSIPVHIQRLIN